MDQIDKDTIKSAIELLLEEIENNIDRLNKSIETAAKDQDYERTKIISDEAIKLKSFKNNAESLQKDWQNFISGKFMVKETKKITKKFKRGLKTPESDYCIPILSCLTDLGGEAEVNIVLEKLFGKMKDRLNDYDLKGLPTNPNIKRWNNTARWCRGAMVRDGLLSTDSPRGVWKITDKGREYLDNHIKNVS